MNEPTIKELKQFILEIYVDLVDEYSRYSTEEIPQYDMLTTIKKLENKLKEII